MKCGRCETLWIKKDDCVDVPVSEWYEAYFNDGHIETCKRYRLVDVDIVFFRPLILPD